MIRNGASFDGNKWPDLAKANGGTTLPDDRGLFIRGYDPTGVNDAEGKTRGFASFEEGSAAAVTAMLGGRLAAPFYKIGDLPAAQFDSPHSYDLFTKNNVPDYSNRLTGDYYDVQSTIDENSTIIGITRPKNRNYLPIVYAGPPVS